MYEGVRGRSITLSHPNYSGYTGDGVIANVDGEKGVHKRT